LNYFHDDGFDLLNYFHDDGFDLLNYFLEFFHVFDNFLKIPNVDGVMKYFKDVENDYGNFHDDGCDLLNYCHSNEKVFSLPIISLQIISCA
jgi:hypothetical protein